jgi:hypothetical protein
MNTFELTLSDTYQEILQGGYYVAFDVLADGVAQVYLSTSEAAPTGAGSDVQAWPAGWDFEASSLPEGQRVWLRGYGPVRGVRG